MTFMSNILLDKQLNYHNVFNIILYELISSIWFICLICGGCPVIITLAAIGSLAPIMFFMLANIAVIMATFTQMEEISTV